MPCSPITLTDEQGRSFRIGIKLYVGHKGVTFLSFGFLHRDGNGLCLEPTFERLRDQFAARYRQLYPIVRSIPRTHIENEKRPR
jgi:hypothetical protein